jgi:hypothetical protein
MELQTHLYQHQKDGLAKALSNPTAFGLLAETGTGKSVMVLAEFQERLGKDITDLLVIAPMGCIRNWYLTKGEKISELERHLNPELFKRLFIITNRRKAADKKQQDAMLKVKSPRALFVNIEALSRGGRDETLCTKLLSNGKVMLVIDESTTIRSYKSQRSKAVMRLGNLATCKRILTGLVTPKSPLDLYNQMNFLDRKILASPSYVGFRARYARVKIICREPESIVDMRLRQILLRKRIKMNTHDMRYQEKVEKIIELGGWIQHIPIIEGYQNLDELQKKIAPYTYQILKKDCLDLEPKTYQFRDVEMTPEQKRIYKDVLHDATAELGDGTFVTANSVLSQMQRLHQIVCGHVRNENGELKDIGTNRMIALNEILQEHDGKAIIWVCYIDLIVRDTVEEKIVWALRKKIDLATAITGENFRQWLV